MMTSGYKESAGSIIHRFLVLGLKREENKLDYLRLDRRLAEPLKAFPKYRYSSPRLSRAPTILSASFALLIGAAQLGNGQLFKIPPILAQLRDMLLITCEELPKSQL